MQAFEVKTKKSDYPFLIIASGFGKVVEILKQKDIYDTDIITICQLDVYKYGHILCESELKTKEELKNEVRRELQKDMPRWRKEGNGVSGGGDVDRFLIRGSMGHYFMSTCIGGSDGHYLVLKDLEQLPGLEE